MSGMTATTTRKRVKPAGRAGRGERRARLLGLLERLPGVKAVPVNGRHLSLEVRGRRFGWLLDDHHGDQRLALHCRAPAGANRMLVTSAPLQFFLPPYLGNRGWVGAWLDLDGVDWAAVDAVLDDAYRLAAPLVLLRQLWDAK